MAGITQGPAPAGPSNSTRFNVDVYIPTEVAVDLAAQAAAVAEACGAAGLTLDPRRLVVTATAPGPHKPAVRVNVTGEIVGVVLTGDELRAALAPVAGDGRCDADVWAIYRDDAPKGAQ